MFEQELGRMKRLKVKDIHNQTFVGLDGKAVTPIKKIYTRFDGSRHTRNIKDEWFVLITYDGGKVIYPVSDYVQEVGEVNA